MSLAWLVSVLEDIPNFFYSVQVSPLPSWIGRSEASTRALIGIYYLDTKQMVAKKKIRKYRVAESKFGWFQSLCQAKKANLMAVQQHD